MNVGSYLTQAARLWPQEVALSDGYREVTFEELDREASGFAAGLRRRGYQPADRVVIFMSNRVEYLAALFGLFKGGYVAVPVNVKLHHSELAFILTHSEARAVVHSTKTGSTVQQAMSSLVSVDRVDVDATDETSYGELVRSASEGVGSADAEVDPDSTAWIFYTSGTTGRPKGAMLSHRNLAACTVNCLADMIDFQPEDVALHVAPLSHGSGLYALPAIARGAKSLIYAGESFDPADVLMTMRRAEVTVIPFLAPTMIHMLVEADSTLEVPRFRRAVYGGSPIDSKLAKAAIERFGSVFVQLYGQGESPMTITRLRSEDHRGNLLHSAGSVRTNVEVRLVNERDEPVVDGEEGEICVRGDVVMSGYLNDPEADARALRGGWLHTGDVGRFQDGYLYLLSRQNDVIISGGTNIYPREVEEALLMHPGVVEACVFAEPDPKWGDSIVAAVVASEPLTQEELQDFCRSNIASFKKPKRIEFVDSLQKNAYGKVDRREVQAALIASRGESQRALDAHAVR